MSRLSTSESTDDASAGVRVPRALELRGVSKSYDGIPAVVGVDFSCESGEVHALVGANGSGKSTLLGAASGARRPDGGEVYIGGQRLETASPSLAHDLGLAAVYQDNSHVTGLSVAQNLYLAVPRGLRPDYCDRDGWAEALLARYDLDIGPRGSVEYLEPARRQLLEIVKAFAMEPRVVLLDEPTTALSAREVERLHHMIRSIVSDGAGVVYVSHRLPEVLDLADRVTVLRDGRSRGTFANADLAEARVVELMLGVPVDFEFPAKASRVEGESVALRAQELTGEGLGPVSFIVRAGEVVGIAGAEGNGQRQLVRAIAGLHPVEGRIERDGRRVPTGSVAAALRSGTMLLSGDRANESVFPDLSVRENMTLQVLGRFSTLGLVHARAERAEARRLVDQLAIKTPHVERAINTLSGGNQQKAVISRAFVYPADVIVIDEPTQGVDAGARLDIFRAVRARADQGAAVIVNASDAAELEGLCDRVLVLSRGKIVRELVGPEVTEAAIIESFLTVDSADRGAEGSRDGVSGSGARKLVGQLRNPTVSPLLLLVGLIVGLALFTNADNPNFLSGTNIGFTLTNLVPIALVAMAQLNVLLVRGFDVSVGAVMSLSVVMSSVLIAPGSPMPYPVAMVLIGAMGIAVGLLNCLLVRGFGIPSIIATLATLSIVQGIALRIRPVVGEPIDRGFRDTMATDVDVVPLALIVVVVVAIISDAALYRTGAGARLRSTGFAEQSARRVGVRTEWVYLRAYVMSGFLAAAAGLFVGVNIGNGDPTAGGGFILISFAACVLGGASLLGGRGTFVGAVFGALLLAVIDKMPGFLELNAALGEILTGGLTLAAIVLYSGGDAVARARHLARRRILIPLSESRVSRARKGSS